MPIRLADLAAAAETALAESLASPPGLAPRLGPRIGLRFSCPFVFVGGGPDEPGRFEAQRLDGLGDALVEASAARLAGLAPDRLSRLIVRAQG